MKSAREECEKQPLAAEAVSRTSVAARLKPYPDTNRNSHTESEDLLLRGRVEREK